MLLELWQGLWKLSLLSAFVLFNALVSTFNDRAVAQIVPDNTLGDESSLVTPNSNVRGLPATLIEGGATRGVNLFQSFSQFNVGDGQRVYFANPVGIDNILTRVTGNSVSNIFGTLGVDGNANLFFLNPNGIVFGENASLDVAGSFLATTADGFDFGNGLGFSANNPQAAPLLSVSVIPGLQFGANPGDIQNQSREGLKVQPGKNLALVGGNVSLESGILNAPGGRIELGGLKESGTIRIDNNFKLNFPIDVERADVSLSNGARVDVAAGGGGDIAVNARSLNISGSALLAGILENLGGVEQKAGDITLNATDTVTISQTSGIINAVYDNGIGDSGNINVKAESLSVTGGASLIASTLGRGNAGNINITTDSVSLSDGAYFSSSTLGIGNAGNVTVNAKDSVSLVNANIFSNVGTGAQGDGGDIDITTDSLSLSDGAFFSSSTFGIGNAGNVTVNAKDSVSLVNADIFSSVGAGAQGDGGDIDITTATFSLSNGSQLQTSIRQTGGTLAGGKGNAGDVTINANKLELDGINDDGLPSAIFSDLGSGAEGNAGNINITTDSVSLSDGAYFSSSTLGIGNAGNVTVNAADSASLVNANIFSNVGTGAQGDGGDIDITTATFSLSNGSQLQTSIRQTDGVLAGGKGNAGDVTINANKLELDGINDDGLPSAIFSDLGSGAEGNAGNINITGDSLSLSDGTYFSSSTFGIGNAGNVTVNAADSVSLVNADIFSSVGAGAQGDGGDIDITTDSVSLSDGALFSSSTFGIGNAGNVTVNAPDSVSLVNAGIFSNVGAGAQGDGGDIDITTDSVSLSDGALFSSSTFGIGNAGNVTVNAADSVSLFNANIFSSVEAGAQGDGGDIDITTATLSLSNGSQLQTSIRQTDGTLAGGKGNAGDVTINANKLELDGINEDGLPSAIFSNLGIGAEGNAGNINITADSVSLSDGTFFSSSTFGIGNAGNVTVNAADSVSLFNANIFSNVEAGAQGDGGDIDITTATLSLSNGSQLQTFIRQTNGVLAGGKGNAGDVTINANKLEFDGRNDDGLSSAIFSELGSGAEGNAGNINITGDSVSLTNGAVLSSNTFGKGNAGNINITAGIQLDNEGNPILDSKGHPIPIGSGGQVTFDGAGTGVFSRVSRTQDPQNPDNEFVGMGQGGTINIQARSLSVLGGANLSAQTLGIGDAGNILVNTSDFVEISGFATYPTLSDGRPGGFSSGLFTTTENGATGEGGMIKVTTDSLRLDNGGVLSNRTQSDFKGGDISVDANTLEITGGGQILTTAFGNGNAGDIKVRVRDNITISGSDATYNDRYNQVAAQFGEEQAQFTIDPINPASGIFANTAEDSTGQGGNINIDPELVKIENGAIIAVDSQGSGQAGNLALTSNRLILDKGKITAATNTTNGGNITLNLQDLLLLRENSKISATAGQQGGTGDGGNVTIKTPNGFVVGLQDRNNDIVARASVGQGGEINIEAQSIFGLAERSSQPPNQTNDIDASSDFGTQGTVNLNTPDVDPASAINTLPQDMVDPSNQIDQGCAVLDEDNISEFRVTGRGGLPPSPDEPLSSNTVWEDTRTTTTAPQKLTTDTTAKTPKAEANKITPATAWVFNKNGEVTLISSASKTTPEKLGTTPKSCPTR